MIDMEAADTKLRDTEDNIERLRDPSHVKNMSKAEMLSMFAAHGLSIQRCETAEIQQRLKSWLALTKTPESVCREITKRMEMELRGEIKTGFSPYIENEEICFDQRWILIIGKKENITA